MFASTFTATTDPMLSERVYHSAVLALSGDEPKAAAELDGALAAAAKLEDADRARGLAAEARYVIELIRDDDAWRSARPRIEALAGRLQSPVATD
jgi:hypothetical protein